MQKAEWSKNSEDSSTNRREFLGKLGKPAIAATAATAPFIGKSEVPAQ